MLTFQWIRRCLDCSIFLVIALVALSSSGCADVQDSPGEDDEPDLDLPYLSPGDYERCDGLCTDDETVDDRFYHPDFATDLAVDDPSSGDSDVPFGGDERHFRPVEPVDVGEDGDSDADDDGGDSGNADNPDDEHGDHDSDGDDGDNPDSEHGDNGSDGDDGEQGEFCDVDVPLYLQIEECPDGTACSADTDDFALDCPKSYGFWKNHEDLWPFSESCALEICGESVADILWSAPAGGNAWMVLTRQWIAAAFNVISGVGDDEIVDILFEALPYVATCDDADDFDDDAALDWADELEAFNSNSGDIASCK